MIRPNEYPVLRILPSPYEGNRPMIYESATDMWHDEVVGMPCYFDIDDLGNEIVAFFMFGSPDGSGDMTYTNLQGFFIPMKGEHGRLISKKWQRQITENKIPGTDVPLPMYAQSWTLRIVMKADGSFQWLPKYSGPEAGLDLYQQAREWCLKVHRMRTPDRRQTSPECVYEEWARQTYPTMNAEVTNAR